MTPKVIARDPHFPRGRFTLADVVEEPVMDTHRLTTAETEAFATNDLLQNFIADIMKDPGADDLGSRVQRILNELSHERERSLLTIDQYRFASDVLSPWEENNQVYAYLFRRTDAKEGGPGIVIPGFIKGCPMTRALTLLLTKRGWSVLEVAVPFFGRRRVAITKAHSTLSQRYADLRLTPEDFAGYIEQAVSDVRQASQWFSRQSFVDTKCAAISGFSFGGFVGLTAFATTPALTHSVSLSPPVDWAVAIWKAKDQKPYRRLLQSWPVTQQEFFNRVSPVQLDQLAPLGNRANKSQILYAEGDPYTPKEAMEHLAGRLGGAECFEPDGAGKSEPHINGLNSHFATVFERIVELVTGAKPSH